MDSYVMLSSLTRGDISNIFVLALNLDEHSMTVILKKPKIRCCYQLRNKMIIQYYFYGYNFLKYAFFKNISKQCAQN